MPRITIIAAFLSSLLLAGAASSQSAAPCAGDEHRAFDFWIGRWRVESAAGDTLGHNTITRVAGGCALREEWRGQGGSTGSSLNYHDPADDRWHQLWVGSGGLVLHLGGGPEEGAMVLSGPERSGRRGPVRDRITWTPAEDGSVHQLWEVSSDRGESWQVAFEGFYRRED